MANTHTHEHTHTHKPFTNLKRTINAITNGSEREGNRKRVRESERERG